MMPFMHVKPGCSLSKGKWYWFWSESV
uniref:Uncharacterized protein n=1 Tax=Rhizophora mucronata TaxID=61149 RepID=A0A2P2PIR8_RHIMU